MKRGLAHNQCPLVSVSREGILGSLCRQVTHYLSRLSKDSSKKI